MNEKLGKGERVALVVNPHAGAGRGARIARDAEERLRAAGFEVSLRPTDAPRAATRIVRAALEEGFDGIVTIGGDGTFSESVAGFFTESGVAIRPTSWLGLLTAGTGGDFARYWKIPKNVDAMIDRLVRSTPRTIDIGWITYTASNGATGSRPFLNIASFGISGEVDSVVNDGPKWLGGRIAFFSASLRVSMKWPNPKVRLRLDDGSAREYGVLTTAVANGKYFGGGMMIAPNAETDDGLFDVVGIEDLSRADAFLLSRHFYTGTHLGRTGVTEARARRVHAEPVNPHDVILLDVDGETPGKLPATFEMKAGSLFLRV